MVSHGRLYVGTNAGKVLGVDAATGRVAWRRTVGGCVASSPGVAGGIVFVATMAPPPCAGTRGGALLALDGGTGATRWRVRTAPIESSPLVAGSLVIVGSWDGRVRALDAATGAGRWTFATRGPVKSGAALRDGTVYIGSYDRRLYALDAHTGRLRWASAEAGGGFYATPTVTDGSVFAGSIDGVVHALEAATGAERWRRRIGPYVYSAAAAADGLVYVGPTITASTRSTRERATSSGLASATGRSPVRRP